LRYCSEKDEKKSTCYLAIVIVCVSGFNLNMADGMGYTYIVIGGTAGGGGGNLN